MRSPLKAAVALILVSAGGWLLYRGAHEYWIAQSSQTDAEAAWDRIKQNAARTEPSGSNLPAQERKRKRVREPLAEGAPFSHLEVPRLEQSLYVVEGSHASALKKGPGHVRGSAMPGDDGNCVIAGHRDLHFRFLKDLEPGDKIYLETTEGRYCYRVKATSVIPPTQLDVLQPTPDPELHLITCYPFYFIGHAPKRFVVTAALEQPAPDRAVRSPRVLGQRGSYGKAAPRRPQVRAQTGLEATRALNLAGADGL